MAVKLQVLDLRPKHQEKCFTNWDTNKSLGLWRAIPSYLGNLGSQSDFWGLASLLCPLVTGSQWALRLVPADGSLMRHLSLPTDSLTSVMNHQPVVPFGQKRSIYV